MLHFFAFICSFPLENILIYFCDKLITTRELGRQDALGWEVGGVKAADKWAWVNLFGFKSESPGWTCIHFRHVDCPSARLGRGPRPYNIGSAQCTTTWAWGLSRLRLVCSTGALQRRPSLSLQNPVLALKWPPLLLEEASGWAVRNWAAKSWLQIKTQRSGLTQLGSEVSMSSPVPKPAV